MVRKKKNLGKIKGFAIQFMPFAEIRDLDSNERIKKILLTGVDDLELSVRSHNCLKSADIKTLGDLVRKDENEMLKFRNFGRKSLSELTEIVDNYGLDFGMDVDKYINYGNDNN